jgi:TrmH RNA methyltransferase
MAKRPETEVVFGLRAGLAVIAARREDILRAGYSQSVRHELPHLPKSIDAREMSDAELAKVSGSTHHEGLVLQTKPREWLSAAQLAERLIDTRGVAIALDRVRNPYNVGAILRSAAFFGVQGAVLGALAPHPALAPDAIRVAEGGAEHVALVRTTDLADTLSRLRARGIAVIGTDGAATKSAIGYSFQKPVILVLGHEREGLSDRVRQHCTEVLAIRGTGAIESLKMVRS